MGRQKDSEARWTQKHNETHYGWKNHVKADLKTKLILQSKTTPASVHDSQVFAELLDEQDQAVLADPAYHSAAHEAHLIQLNAQEFLMRKATRGQPLSEKPSSRPTAPSAACACGWSTSSRGWRRWGPAGVGASG